MIATEAEAAALTALRAATGETDGDMERHTMGQYLIGVAVIVAFNAVYWLPIRGESPHART